MSEQQNPTINEISTNIQNINSLEQKSYYKNNELSQKHLAWIDYCAVQGLITEADGSTKKMSVDEFADKLGVNKTTLYDWRKKIPNFWDLVRKRSREIFSETRTIKVWNAVYVAATNKLNTDAQKLWLANCDREFKMPNQKVEVDAGGGLLDLINIYQKRVQGSHIINAQEAEIIDNKQIEA